MAELQKKLPTPDANAPAAAHSTPSSMPSGEAQRADEARRAMVPAKGSVSAVAAQAKDVASEVAHQAQELVTAQITNHQTKSASDIGAVAKALRDTGKQLENNMVSPYLGKAADHMERLSQFIRTASVEKIKGTTESFAQREPSLFLGGAFVLGIIGARFLKSSSRGEAQSAPAEGRP